MSDIAALKSALDEAEAAKAALIEERREKRDSLSKADFRAYNETTKSQQLQAQAEVDKAEKALQEALNQVRSDALAQAVPVGTVKEGSSGGGVTNG